MSKTAKEIACTADETNTLDEIINNPQTSPQMAKRCRMILMACKGKTNKEIAKELNSDEHVVANWRNRYASEGIAGLQDSPRPGRKGGKADETLDSRFLKAVGDGEKWTAETLAEHLGISVKSTKYLLKKHGVSLHESKTWTIAADDGIGGKASMAGLYLSGNGLALAIRDTGKASPAECPGMFTTHTGFLGKKLEKCAGEQGVSLATALDGAIHYMDSLATDTADGGVSAFIDDLAHGLPSGTGIHAICYSGGENILYKATNVFVLPTESVEKWLQMACEQIDGICGASDAAAAERLKGLVKEYVGKCGEHTEPFVYRRTAMAEPSAGTAPSIPAPPGVVDAIDDSPWDSLAPKGKPWIGSLVAYCDSEGNMKQYANVAKDGIPDYGSIDFSSVDSVIDNVSRIEEASVALANKAAEQMATAALEGIKKKDGTSKLFSKDVTIETLAGTVVVNIEGRHALGLANGKRLRTPGFARIEGFLASRIGYRTATVLLNLIAKRDVQSGNWVNDWDLYDDVVSDGIAIQHELEKATDGILDENGVSFDDDGNATGMPPQKIEDPVFVSAGEGVEPWNEKEEKLRQAILAYNKSNPSNPIKGLQTVETNLSAICRVAIDDVLVHMQKPIRRNGVEMVKQTWIYHTVVHIEFDGKVYVLEASSQGKACRMLCAFLLKNGLGTKFLMFFTDGEEALGTSVEKVFGEWPHAFLLDWLHIEKRFLESFSKVFKPGKVADPEATPETFKNGKVKKGSIPRITRSKLRLREFCRILWVGDIDGAMEYLRRAKECKEEMKAGGEQVLDSLMDYLRRKKDRMACFALRKFLGLRNSSNRVEKANDVLVSQRQKGKGLSWCANGSFAVSQVTMVFKNEEALSYYKGKGFSFSLRPMAKDMESEEKRILSWLSGNPDVSSACAYKQMNAMA